HHFQQLAHIGLPFRHEPAAEAVGAERLRPRRFRWQSLSKTAYPEPPPTAPFCPAASVRITPPAFHLPLYPFPGNPSPGWPPTPMRRSRPTRPPPARFAPA